MVLEVVIVGVIRISGIIAIARTIRVRLRGNSQRAPTRPHSGRLSSETAKVVSELRRPRPFALLAKEADKKVAVKVAVHAITYTCAEN